ncbi:MAG: redoxin domain-containing protein [Pyrinomonadaceae bacterium]|nr:redoxin domain-containing protein [Pyrinomonadaceae bacterium]
MEVIIVVIRLFLFGVFALAGIGKLLDREGSEKAVREFGVPDDLAKPAAIGLPILELVIAFALLFGGTSWLASIAALLLLLVFIGGMLYQMAKGNAPDCHCFGQLHSEPVGKSSLIRNIGFAILALFVAVQGRENQGASLSDGGGGLVQSLLLIAVLAGVAVVIFFLKSLMDQQKQVLRRLEILEIVGGGGVAQEREDAGNPEDAMPMGAPFPDFALPDVSGKQVTFEHLFANAKPMLFFFLGPNCNPCKALYPEIEEWSGELGGKVHFVLVSSGKAEDNLKKFDGPLGRNMLLQTNRELAEKVHSKWTPTAMFVDADGNIASHPAVGDAAIRELVGKIKNEDVTREHVHFALKNGQPIKIGSKAPEAVLTDLNGKELKTAELAGKKTLVVFWSLSCPHCRTMMAEIKEWESTRASDDVRMIIFSNGEPHELREAGLETPIFLDPDFKVSIEFGMFGTPSAVLVDENGVIRSESAIGAPNIWSLIGGKN